ncbi:glucodextranase DOMON-like domain-containing protein [Halapricum hydrolyticum]|uniref:Alpha-amylase family glycosyl hydrolase n=2 Tax=Halapricum hydrolyticum TaxID=2979991 RepID=A0AAE3LED8_9EURY|nr:glucodextranase DOMON-like domain-containing protein [Halapricum hydrolyticum]MCU4716530.1 alpha-amylase family glycosyl hydrolase [Halapricum hydrolyticum]MCU4725865.1 alpha-amylase family glycosyl hydrolase [Halapricum hydrolyticum]
MATLGTFSAVPAVTEGAQSLATTRSVGDSHHPGPPRVMHAGEKLVDPLTPDYRGDGAPDGRNTLAPRIPEPERDPDNYGSEAFTWRVVDTPDDSDVSGFYSNPGEYDYGTGVEEFDPDVPGTYTLALDAPDGTHQLTVRVFPEPPDGAAGPPRVDPVSEYGDGEFVIEANATPAPDSRTAPTELTVEFLTDDRDGLSADDLTVEGATATVPADAIEGTARVHVVAADDQPGIIGTAELDADAGETARPDTPPEWIHDSVMYTIFTRSFGSEAGEVDFQYLQDRVDYLADLGVDIVWLTPIVEASTHVKDDPAGGPHGYDTTNYFETADPLGSVEEYEAFVDACHEQDIKVCFDLVINHTDIQHPFFADADANGTDSKYYEWFERLEDGTPNHYFGWTNLMNINYQSVAMREHILAAVDFWTDIVDGFRCDIAYGVPHDFWKEIRQLIRAKDSDVFLLDEAIPYDARFSEGEFDMHFDEVLAENVRAIGQGGVNAERVLEATTERKQRGVPDWTVFLQYVETHDMSRYLDVAEKTAERAAAAATFTLPGVPMLYYGQERAIAEYSEPRLEERGHFRSFMNWDEYDAEHLAFYKSLVDARKEVPALQHDAALRGAYYESDSEQVVAYGRDAGDQKAVVVLHFGEGTETVALRGPVSTTDLVSGTDVGIESDDGLTHVEVDSVAVLETLSLSGLGPHLAGTDDEVGDDHGPGGYTYPTGDAYTEGAFDLTGLDIHETDTEYQLRFTVDGPVENPDGYDGGFSAQHVQVYVRDPTDPDGGEFAREGLDALLADPYQCRIVADGEHGARVETPEGETVAEGSVFASPSTNSIRIDIPDHAIPGDPTELELAPLLLGYDPDAPGNVMGVGESADEGQFGGRSGENAPQVIDMIAPEGITQAEALDPGEDLAEIPYVVLGDPFDGEVIERFEDEVGDDHGPGSYTYPDDEDMSAGDLDVESVTVYDDGDRYRFAYRFAGDLTNPWSGEYGFSAQHLQLYVRNPASDAPTATNGRPGTNVAFADPYHYRIKIEGYEGHSVVENAAGEVVTDDVTVGAYRSMDTIAFSVPKSALGGEIDSAEIAPLAFGFDPEGPGRVRQVRPAATEMQFGGGTTDDDPAVIDMLVPEGASQSDVLESGDALPYLSLAGFSGTLLHSWDDEVGDDHGPGSYTYPTAEDIPADVYDITKVELYEVGDRYRFVYYLNGPITNPWSGSDGFSLHNFQVYIHDPNATDLPSGTEAREGVNVAFSRPYHYRVVVDGYSLRSVVAGDGETITQDVEAQAHPDLGAIAFDMPGDAFERDLADHHFMPLILGHDNYGTGAVRAVSEDGGKWEFGGGTGTNDPGVIDMITPEGTTQSEALEYSPDQQAKLPYVPKIEGEPGQPMAVASADRTVFASTDVELDGSGSSDPEGQELTYEWVQIAGPDVDLSDAAAVQPTFTAPDVDEETELEFELAVTDPDSNSATATATVTVRPQSANDAPIADAGEDRTVDPGEMVSLQAVSSEDPNGGTLSYQWEQTTGPDVELTGADSIGAAFKVPEVEEDTGLVFELTVDDGQGKTATDSVTITVRSTGDGDGTTTTETETEEGDGFGPGFGVVTGLVGAAGGTAYVARRRLGGDEDEE